MMALDRGDYRQAGVHLAECLICCQAPGYRWQIAFAVELCAILAALQGQQRDDVALESLRAARLLGAAEALRETRSHTNARQPNCDQPRQLRA